MENVRIDKGIKRGNQGSTPGSHAHQPRNDDGSFLPVCDILTRNEIVDDSIVALRTGETIKEIAARRGVHEKTLGKWLLADDRAINARKAYFDSVLIDGVDEIATSDAPLSLARAREKFRANAWLAERRVKEYAPKQESTVTVIPVFSIQLPADIPGECCEIDETVPEK